MTRPPHPTRCDQGHHPWGERDGLVCTGEHHPTRTYVGAYVADGHDASEARQT